MILVFVAIGVTVVLVFAFLNDAVKGKKSVSKFNYLILSLRKYFFVILIFMFTSMTFYIIFYNVKFISDMVFNIDNFVYGFVALLLFSMSIALLFDGIFVIPFIQFLYEKFMIKKLESIYKVEDLEYYRDIIKSVSPAILSYCYNKKINIEDEVIAILLNLQIKHIIKFDNSHLVFVDDVSSLSKHEMFVVKNIKKFYNNKLLHNKFRKLLIQDMLKDGYIYQEETNKLNITYIMEFFMAWMIIYILAVILFYMSAKSNGIFLILISYFFTFFGVPFYKFIQSKICTVIRTNKAIELSAKLRGLKNYVNDFSIIKDLGVENVNIFDEYVLYAIIFNLKGRLNDECFVIYKNVKDFIISSN